MTLDRLVSRSENAKPNWRERLREREYNAVINMSG